MTRSNVENAWGRNIPKQFDKKICRRYEASNHRLRRLVAVLSGILKDPEQISAADSENIEGVAEETVPGVKLNCLR